MTLVGVGIQHIFGLFVWRSTSTYLFHPLSFFSLKRLKQFSLGLLIFLILMSMLIWKVSFLKNFEYQYYLKDFIEFKFMAIGVLAAFYRLSDHPINDFLKKYQVPFFLLLVILLYLNCL